MENKKHIVMVGNTVWSMYNFRGNLIRKFIDSGYKVTVIAPNESTLHSDNIKKLGADFSDIKISAKGTNIFEDLKLIKTFYKTFKVLNPDFIFLYTIKPNIYGGIAAKLAKIPFIAVTTGLGYTFTVDNIVSKVARSLYKYSFKYANQVWFLNNDDKKDFLKFNLVDEAKTYVLNGEGVDTKRYELTDLPNKIQFLFMARMLWDKGLGEFANAAKMVKLQYPEVEFNLLGFLNVDNPSAVSEQQINDWQSQGIIKYLGSTDNVVPYLKDTTCLVLPSYYREGIPMTLLEAASMGRILITTDNVGCRETVDDNETGFLCQIKNAEDLKNKMLRVIEMSVQERSNMGIAARNKILNEFAEVHIFDSYFAALHKYIK